MAEPDKIVLKRADLELQELNGGGSFALKLARVGAALGLTKLGCMMQVVPPGKRAFPHHVHHVADEMMLILEGEAEYRWGEEMHRVGPGDMIGAPAGTRAHQLANIGEVDLVYLTFSSNHEADVVEYPDSGKVGFRAGMSGDNHATFSIRAVGRMTETDYWDGEVT